MHSVIIILYF